MDQHLTELATKARGHEENQRILRDLNVNAGPEAAGTAHTLVDQ